MLHPATSTTSIMCPQRCYTHFIVNYDPTVILVIVLSNLLERVDSLLAPSHQMNATTTGCMTRSSAVQAVAAFSTQQVQQTVLREECGGSREKSRPSASCSLLKFRGAVNLVYSYLSHDLS